MALADIRRRLVQWKSEDFYTNSKSYKEMESPVSKGEYFYKLEQIVKLNFPGVTKTVQLKKTFHTLTLAPEPISDNPLGDLHRLNQLLPVFDNEFYQLVEDQINQIIDEINPQGFF